MEIIVKREDIPGGIKFTTKDCEYPRHFTSTIRQALLLDGLDEDTVEAIFGKAPNTVCASTKESHLDVADPEQLAEQSMTDVAKSLGTMPIGESVEGEKEASDEYELPKGILTNDCEILTENSEQLWYKDLARHLENPAIIYKFMLQKEGGRTALYNKQRGLVVEPIAPNRYGVTPLDICNSIDAIEDSNRFRIFESLADALNFAM